MSQNSLSVGDSAVLDISGLDALFRTIAEAGYELIGPTIRDQAIIYDRIQTTDDLPAGWTDEQQPAFYRLKRREDQAFFGYNAGPQSFKRFLYAPRLSLWTARRKKGGFELTHNGPIAAKLALVGVRACELNAIYVQDRVFVGGEFKDDDYVRRRRNVFLLAVNCTQAGGTCFCASTKTGPRVRRGFDLALTEILDNGQHLFVIQVGSEAGGSMLVSVGAQKAAGEMIDLAEQKSSEATQQMGRSLDITDLKDLFNRNLENVRWEKTGKRCLACANCTFVCPTCFCSTIEDTTSLSGDSAERTRRWDACFTMDFSYIHGGSVRPSAKARYRQWLTHKLGNWDEQFGSLGCVGCGRCITWCPVGIDITEEARAIRESDLAPAPTAQRAEVE